MQAIVQTGPGNPGGTAPLLSFHADSGRLAWQVDLPTLVQTAPLEVPGGLLLQAADPGYGCRLAGAARGQSRSRFSRRAVFRAAHCDYA